MESISQAIKQDISAAVIAFDQDDFSEMNMFANRIMANAIFGEVEDLFLSGFFLKDVAGLFLNLRAMPKSAPLSTAKTVATKYVISVKEFTSAGTIDVKVLWVAFYQFSRDMRKFLTSETEKRVYSDNAVFTHHSFKWLMRYLKDHKEILQDPKNFFFKGILNEFERIFRNYSGELDDVLAISLFRALDRLYDYVAVVNAHDGKIDEDILKKSIYPYVETMEQLAYPEKREQFSDVTNVLWTITKQWRELFLQYMDIERVKAIAVQRAIELPAEMKAKLTESVSKTLEKEMKVE